MEYGNSIGNNTLILNGYGENEILALEIRSKNDPFISQRISKTLKAYLAD